MTISQINAYCVKTYGHKVTEVESTAAMWVAEHFGGWASWKKISSARNRVGRGTPFPEFGSPCWV